MLTPIKFLSFIPLILFASMSARAADPLTNCAAGTMNRDLLKSLEQKRSKYLSLCLVCNDDNSCRFRSALEPMATQICATLFCAPVKVRRAFSINDETDATGELVFSYSIDTKGKGTDVQIIESKSRLEPEAAHKLITSWLNTRVYRPIEVAGTRYEVTHLRGEYSWSASYDLVDFGNTGTHH